MPFHIELNSHYSVKQLKNGSLVAYYLGERLFEIEDVTPLRLIMEDMAKAMVRQNDLFASYEDHPDVPPHFKDVERIDITLSDGTRFVEKEYDEDVGDYSKYVFILNDGTEMPGDPQGLAFLAAMNLQEALYVIEELEPFEKEPVKEISLQVTITGQEWALIQAMGGEVLENTDLLRSSVMKALNDQICAKHVSYQADVLSITDLNTGTGLEPDDGPNP